MDVSALTANPPATGTNASATDGLKADDFLKLLVTQLTHQDPLEPTSNEALLEQLSSIREIQLSTKLTDSLETLTGNQRYGAAAALIGKHVEGTRVGAEAGDPPAQGAVVSIQFDENGHVQLELDSGERLALENLTRVTDPQSLVGRIVRGFDRDNPDAEEPIEGIVTAVRRDEETNETMLELDTGETLPLSDVFFS